MEVILAGFNLDNAIIDELKKGNSNLPVTPETISAAYARISRYPQRVDELRRQSREEVEKARNSNRTIIFEMGHHSVAEHACFNFDVIGISRLAVELLQGFRLASFTEKSQRYITLRDDYVLPREIVESGFEKEFKALIQKENELYRVMVDELKLYHASHDKSLAADKRELANRAKEDARFVASLATQSQLGMTVNARELELMVRRLASHPLSEAKELGEKLCSEARAVAPSILLFCEANPFDSETYPALASLASEKIPLDKNPQTEITLVEASPEPDLTLLTSLLYRVSSTSFQACRATVNQMDEKEKLELVKIAFERAELYDSMLREFEHVALTFEIICSASCFAQLKRHRMATISAQSYDVNLGCTIPESIEKIKKDKEFKDLIGKCNDLYHNLLKINPDAAGYALTNAHRRRVLLTVNARELYHFSRLRSDAHAQWEIREVSERMIELGRAVMPLTLMLAGGKDSYPVMYEKIFGHPPRVVAAELPGERKVKYSS